MPTGAGSVQHVFPGTYAVAAKASSYYTAEGQSVVTYFGQQSARTARLAVALSPQGAAKVQASASSWLSKCAASGQLAPSGCPFRAVAEPGITYSNGHWTIQSEPSLEVGKWDPQSDGWQVTTSTPGQITFTADAARGNATGTASTGLQQFVVVGTAVPSGSGISFVPSPSYSPQTGGALT